MRPHAQIWSRIEPGAVIDDMIPRPWTGLTNSESDRALDIGTLEVGESTRRGSGVEIFSTKIALVVPGVSTTYRLCPGRHCLPNTLQNTEPSRMNRSWTFPEPIAGDP